MADHAETSNLLQQLRTIPGKTSDQDQVTEVEQRFENGTRITLRVEKIHNGFLVVKETFKPLPKDKKHSELTDADYDNQHKTARFYVKEDPRKTAKKDEAEEDFFTAFLLDTGAIVAG